jgi:beta-glucanase (GH16 family)
MPARIATIVVVFIALAVGALLAFGATNKPGLPLVMDATFRGSTLDMSVWHSCYPAISPTRGCTSFGKIREREWYIASQNVVASGALHLVAVRKPTEGVNINSVPKSYPYASGMVTSRFNFTYGYLQVTARIPGGPGTWPGLWLLPANGAPAPEIDVMENYGSLHQIQCTLHWLHGGKELFSSGFASSPTDLAKGWHVYGLLWTRHSLTWYLDGKAVYSYKGTGIPRQPMYFIADLAIYGAAKTDSALDIKSVQIRSDRFSADSTYH